VAKLAFNFFSNLISRNIKHACQENKIAENDPVTIKIKNDVVGIGKVSADFAWQTGSVSDIKGTGGEMNVHYGNIGGKSLKKSPMGQKFKSCQSSLFMQKSQKEEK
jgi:hypothetical protein